MTPAMTIPNPPAILHDDKRDGDFDIDDTHISGTFSTFCTGNSGNMDVITHMRDHDAHRAGL